MSYSPAVMGCYTPNTPYRLTTPSRQKIPVARVDYSDAMQGIKTFTRWFPLFQCTADRLLE